jgi:putative methanogenesis marker protein 3
MLLNVNGREVEAGAKARLSDVIKGEPYSPGALIAVTRSTSSIKKGTSEFEIVTPKGSMVVRLNDTPLAEAWRELLPTIVGSGVRWKSSKVLAVGSFPSTLEVDRGRYHYSKYDCYFSLGGFDNKTTYVMVARIDHEGAYGIKDGRFGRITRGRHLLDEIQEGDKILEVRPVVLEFSEKDAFTTTDLNLELEDDMAIETFVRVDLDKSSPVSCEQFLVVAERGAINITDRTSTFSANSDRLDVTLVPEHNEVRQDGDVTVRHQGSGTGRVYFYHVRRQLSPAHNLVGKVAVGQELVRLAPAGSSITIRSNPSRIMSIGMTQKDAQTFLEGHGLKQKRTGLADDSALVAEQEPELTMEIKPGEVVETMGIEPQKVSVWKFNDEKAPRTSHYIRKMTGLDHKPIGTLKVFFTYADMPMITFEGNAKEASVLLPELAFDAESPRGQVGVTNMSRPNRGSIGIRLEASNEFGPTGEERYGTNLAGDIVSDLGLLMKGIKDGDIIYIREPRPGEEFKVAEAVPVPKAPEEAALDEIAEIARGAEFTAHEAPASAFLGASTEAQAPKKPKARKPSGKKTEKKKTTGGRPRAKKPKQG